MSENLAIKITAANLAGGVISGLEGRLKGLANASEDIKKNFRDAVKFAKISVTSGLITKELGSGLLKARKHSGNLEEAMLRYKKESVGAVGVTKQLNKEVEQMSNLALEVQKVTDFDITGVLDIGTELRKSGIGFEALSNGALKLASELAVVDEVAPDVAGGVVILGNEIFELEERSKGLEGNSAFEKWGNAVSKATSLAKLDVATFGSALSNIDELTVESLGLDEKGLAVAIASVSKTLSAPEAGTAISAFARNLSTKSQLSEIGFNQKGEALPFEQVLDNLDKKLDTFGTNVQQKKKWLSEAFGDRGVKAVQPFLDNFDKLSKGYENMADIQQKLDIIMSGSNKKIKSAGGTFSSAAARMFLPLNEMVKAPLDKITEATEGLADLTTGSNTIGEVVSNTSVGALAAGASITIGAGILAFMKGKSVLNATGGLRGLISGAGGVASGIAKGKVLEKTAGVQPVYVTNFAENENSGSLGMLGGAGASAAASAASAASRGKIFTIGGAVAPTLLGAIKGWIGLSVIPAIKTGLITASSAVAGSVLAVGGAIGLAVGGAIGYAFRDEINGALDKYTPNFSKFLESILPDFEDEDAKKAQLDESRAMQERHRVKFAAKMDQALIEGDQKEMKRLNDMQSRAFNKMFNDINIQIDANTGQTVIDAGKSNTNVSTSLKPSMD